MQDCEGIGVEVMAENKKSFIIYTSWKRWLDGLNLEQKGKWLDWMLSYTNDENPQFPRDQAVMIACMMAQDTLKRDLKKYEAKVERIKSARNQNPNNNKELLENNNRTEISTKSVRNQYDIVGVNDNVNKQLYQFYRFVISLEEKNNQSINNNHESPLTLQQLYSTYLLYSIYRVFQCEGPLQRLTYLYNILCCSINLRGGALASSIYNFVCLMIINKYITIMNFLMNCCRNHYNLNSIFLMFIKHHISYTKCTYFPFFNNKIFKYNSTYIK